MKKYNLTIHLIVISLFCQLFFLSNKEEVRIQPLPYLNLIPPWNVLSKLIAYDTLPKRVAHTRKRLLQAALSKNYSFLKQEIEQERTHPFLYSFGPPQTGGAIQFWKAQPDEDQSAIFQNLCALLQLDYILQDSIYIWPSWVNTPLTEISKADTQKMIKIMGEKAYEQMRMNNEYYTGPRTGIRIDGLWMFYLSGD